MSLSTQPSWRLVLLAVLAAMMIHWSITAQAPAPGFANFEGAQTNPIRLSSDGTHLFAVNTPNASLSVFSVSQAAKPVLLLEIPTGLEPVSVNLRTNDEAWVVNQVSNSVSVASVSKGIVTDTIAVKPPIGRDMRAGEPMDVVFAGSNQAYVSASRANAIVVLDTQTHQTVATIPVFGGNPRAMAASPDGSTVYAAFALAGNATTTIPAKLAPPQPPPTNTQLPPPPQVGLIVAATDPAWTSYIKFKMPDHGVVAIRTGPTPSIGRYYAGVGTINLGLTVNPASGDLFVTNTDALNLTFFEENLCGHWVNNRITRIQAATGTVTPFDLNPGLSYGCAPNSADLSSALAQPAGVVADPGGSFLYVAAFGTDRVAKVDTNGNVLSFVEVASPSGSGPNVDPKHKRGPRGLALNAATHTLYVLNRISNTISVIDTSLNKVVHELPVGTDPTPREIKEGRGFLYDAKLSGTGTGACASCHVDGDMDHLAWNLGDPAGSMSSTVQNGKTILFHPMKGPMTTQTLRGLLNLSPYHWRGDKADFAAFNSAFVSLMGGVQLSNQDMAIFTNFANSILFLPNPNQNLDRTLPTTLANGNPVNGQSDFLTLPLSQPGNHTCDSCHTSNPGPGTNRIIDTNRAQPLKVPELRNIYQKNLFDRFNPATIDGFGFNHDGHASGFADFFQDPAFAQYTTTQKNDMAAYEFCFDTGTAPAVGYTRTLNASNVTSTSAQSDWATLQSQAALGNIDLIARGTIQGYIHGLLYQPSSSNYLDDANAVYTQAQLQSLIQAGDTLSFMGVYPGTGTTHPSGIASPAR